MRQVLETAPTLDGSARRTEMHEVPHQDPEPRHQGPELVVVLSESREKSFAGLCAPGLLEDKPCQFFLR